ncbi:MAG TPA: GspH/FimT family pseudopilin [Steroidobacteraceae bacterium]|nr:GspH/FimT family pseudopilin [Steroidobacteraceae bacterium]
MQHPKGVTLIEMLATVSIVAILGALAAPSFQNLALSSERTTVVNNFFHALFLARSEAIKRGQVVTVCKSADGSTCLKAGEWTSGWIVFVNTDHDESPVRDEDEPVLQVYSGWSRGQITSNRPAYSFRPYVQGVVNGTILFCDARGSAEARAIIISHTGRPRVSHRDASNRPLRCASG